MGFEGLPQERADIGREAPKKAETEADFEEQLSRMKNEGELGAKINNNFTYDELKRINQALNMGGETLISLALAENGDAVIETMNKYLTAANDPTFEKSCRETLLKLVA